MAETLASASTASSPVSSIVRTPMTAEEKHARLDNFLKSLWADVYPEAPTLTHDKGTEAAWELLNKQFEIPAGAKVLDVGCGQGVALKHFKAAGHDAVGITLGEDAEVCRKLGYNVLEMDLSFLEFADATFDLVWCRHVLEHSLFPFFSLAEAHRVLKPGGILYVEVPSPDSPCRHEQNRNHYSVLGQTMWLALLQRLGFSEGYHMTLLARTPAGNDPYMGFMLRK